MTDASQQPDQERTPYQRRWSKVRGLTIGLLLSWFSVTAAVLFFARELTDITLFGWPFSFYMAAQGLTLFYLLLVAVYVIAMRHLDRMVEEDSHA